MDIDNLDVADITTQITGGEISVSYKQSRFVDWPSPYKPVDIVPSTLTPVSDRRSRVVPHQIIELKVHEKFDVSNSKEQLAALERSTFAVVRNDSGASWFQTSILS